MKYEKPEVIVLAEAVNAVQLGTGKRFKTLDSIATRGPSPAYEADE
jgi:hypothetical protein